LHSCSYHRLRLCSLHAFYTRSAYTGCRIGTRADSRRVDGGGCWDFQYARDLRAENTALSRMPVTISKLARAVDRAKGEGVGLGERRVDRLLTG